MVFTSFLLSQAFLLLVGEVMQEGTSLKYVSLLALLTYDQFRVLVGLSGQETKSHLCRAVLEAICFQTKEILDAMEKDAESKISILKVDGGMTKSDILLQMQADILGANIERGDFPESTSLGAAIAAGVHLGIYQLEEDDSKRVEPQVKLFTPTISEEVRAKNFKRWNRAVERALGWTLEDEDE